MMLAFQLWILVQHVQNMFKIISAFALVLFRYFSATFPYFSATAAYLVDRLQTQAGDKWPELLVSWAPIFRKKRCKKRTCETMQKSQDVSHDVSMFHTMFRRDLCRNSFFHVEWLRMILRMTLNVAYFDPAGTCHWMAPEVFVSNSYDEKVAWVYFAWACHNGI